MNCIYIRIWIAIQTSVLHAIISVNNAKFRKIPRIFAMDTCDGDGEMNDDQIKVYFRSDIMRVDGGG